MVCAQVAQEFSIGREALYMACNMVDRFLTLTTDLARNVLQLLGVSALFIAAKVEVSALGRALLCSSPGRVVRAISPCTSGALLMRVQTSCVPFSFSYVFVFDYSRRSTLPRLGTSL